MGAAFALAALIAGAWAGVAAAVAVAFYPPMIAATTQLTSELLGALAVTAALAAVAWAWNRGRTAGFAAAGRRGRAGVPGARRRAARRARPRAGGGPAARSARDLAHRGRRRARATLLGVLAIVGPWSAWASRREQSFVPITDGGTATLFVGTYLPGHGTIFGLKHAVANEAIRVHPSIRHKAVFRLPEKVFLDAVAARHPQLTRDAAISAELHRNLRVYLLGRPVAFAQMLATKAWRMWAFPFQGTFRRAGATTIWLHRVLVALALAGLLAGLIRRRSAILGLAAADAGRDRRARHRVRGRGAPRVPPDARPPGRGRRRVGDAVRPRLRVAPAARRLEPGARGLDRAIGVQARREDRLVPPVAHVLDDLERPAAAVAAPQQLRARAQRPDPGHEPQLHPREEIHGRPLLLHAGHGSTDWLTGS